MLFVDIHNETGFTKSDYADELHPSASGYAKMAQVWFKHLKPYLQGKTASSNVQFGLLSPSTLPGGVGARLDWSSLLGWSLPGSAINERDVTVMVEMGTRSPRQQRSLAAMPVARLQLN